jgi:hypothetical protein
VTRGIAEIADAEMLGIEMCAREPRFDLAPSPVDLSEVDLRECADGCMMPVGSRVAATREAGRPLLPLAPGCCVYRQQVS